MMAVKDHEKPHIRQQVEEFHHKFKHPVLPVPTVPADRVVRKRLSFIFEEAFELLEACAPSLWQPGANGPASRQLLSLKGQVQEYIKSLPIDVDLPDAVDALADIDYVVEGTRLEFGVNGWPHAEEVHQKNMLKSTEKDEHGKTIKGPEWTPPDHAAILKRQGWRP